MEAGRKDLFQMLLDAAAVAQPGRPYILVRGRTVTYAQMSKIAQLLGQAIRANGWAGDHNTIAVCTDDPELLAYTIWACASSGISLALCPRSRDPAVMCATVIESGAAMMMTDLEALAGEAWAVY